MQTALQDIEGGVNHYGQPVNNLRVADEVDLLAEDPQHLQDITKAVHQSSNRYRLQITAAKSKTMTIGKHHEQLNVTMDTEELEQVTEFVYLGGVKTEDAQCTADIIRRIGLASAMMRKFNKMR